MNYNSDNSVIRLHQMLSEDDNTDTDDTIIEGSPNFESTRASQFPFDEASIDNISASLSNLQITGTPITPATAVPRRPTTRSTSDLPPSDSKEVVLPELPDQRRRRLPAVEDTYESQADLVLENLPQIIIQMAEMAERNPDESAFENPVEDDVTALFSELRIPAQLIERFRDFRLEDLVRLNQTTQENRLFEISRIQQRLLPVAPRGENLSLVQLAEQRQQQQQVIAEENRPPDPPQAGQPNLDANLGAAGGGNARSGLARQCT
jgi:energy-coupling factor transporter ATP-binding protein EcfA2